MHDEQYEEQFEAQHEEQHEAQHEAQQLKRVKAHKRPATRLFLLLFLTTLFLALSWQSDTTAFFVFFAFVPVFFLLNDRVLLTRDKLLLLILTFLSMFLTAYAGVYWIRNVDPATHLVIALLRGLTMFLPFMAAYLFIFSREKPVNGSASERSITENNTKQPPWSFRPFRSPDLTPILVFIAAWMIMEILHDINIFGMSYGNLGHILAAYPSTIQWYVITGNLGGTLWILLVNLTIVLAARMLIPGLIRQKHSYTAGNSNGHTREDQRSGKSYLSNSSSEESTISLLRAIDFSIITLLPLLISILMYRAPLQTSPTNINVVALHTSMDVYDYKYETDPDALLNAYIASTEPYLNPTRPNIVFWPENALTGGLFMDSLEHSITVKKIRQELLSGTSLQENPGETEPARNEVMLLTGAIIDQVTSPPDPGNYDPRVLYQEEQDYHFKRYNTALFVTRDGPPRVKKKKRLVPMSEIVPKQKFLSPLIRLVPNLEDMNFSPADKGYEYFEIGESSFSAIFDSQGASDSLANLRAGHTGQSANAKETAPTDQTNKTIRINPIICYGSAFSTFTADEVKNTQSGFLAVLLNEGWMQSNVAYRHFHWFAICRAIENRRFLVKSSNEGITTLIDSKGKTTAQLSGKTSGAVTGFLRVNDKMSFYTKQHQWIVFGMLICSTFLILLVWMKRRR